MSGYPIETRAQSATLGDCARLLTTLRADYIPGLRIEIDFYAEHDSKPCVVAQLVDYAHVGEKSEMHRSKWSERRFYSELHLISCGALFDLLITGYRVIDKYFGTGVDDRPLPL